MMETDTFSCQSGIHISRTISTVDYESSIEKITSALDSQLGCFLCSSYEYPNRYKRWDIGVYNPMLVLSSKLNNVSINAQNKRGEVILSMIQGTLKSLPFITDFAYQEDAISLVITQGKGVFSEEERSKQPSVFSLIRAITNIFSNAIDDKLGLYGALGYDLAFQFEPIKPAMNRSDDQRDMVLFLPDSIFVRDHEKHEARLYTYEFANTELNTEGLPRTGPSDPFQSRQSLDKNGDHFPGEYAKVVDAAKEYFKRGDLFEVVPSQTFFRPCPELPSTVFKRLKNINPSPYGFLMNLGEQEYLVGASPEMFVRVTGDMVETCPISGTIARGVNAIEDAHQIRELLNSEKDLNELTMCTDVDRNDKSRICEPGSVEVVGRRQIELYSRLIHTVDHVTGTLRKGFDALDAFLSHTWAVTVTGAPKQWAMQFIENHEKSPRRWYGGAVGHLGFDGNINTGLTLRTMRIHKGIAEVRAGATLLFDSTPDAEEAETELKASALLRVLDPAGEQPTPSTCSPLKQGEGLRVLMVDHQDSFVNTLADYFRQTGAEVTTLRFGFDRSTLADIDPDLVVLSPGPGSPKDFCIDETLAMALALNKPVFGICLGLQGIVEYFGGELSLLDIPQHGKPSQIEVLDTKEGLFNGLTEPIHVGRYHSICANAEQMPDSLRVTAETTDKVVMAVQHTSLPVAAVQFHPESIMTIHNDVGLKIINNAYSLVR